MTWRKRFVSGNGARNRAPSLLPPRENRRRVAANAALSESCFRHPGRGCCTFFTFRICLLLFAPAAKLSIFPDDHLQSRVDDVVWGALNEDGVLLDGLRDRVLQLVFAFHHRGRFIDDRHGFSFAVFVATWTRACVLCVSISSRRLGWSDAHGFRGNVSGVAPAQPGFLSASKINRRAKRNLCAPHNFRSPWR